MRFGVPPMQTNWKSNQKGHFGVFEKTCSGGVSGGLYLVSLGRRPWYLHVAEHFVQIVAAATERQMVQDVLVHELNVGIAQLDRSIVVSVKCENGGKHNTKKNK